MLDGGIIASHWQAEKAGKSAGEEIENREWRGRGRAGETLLPHMAAEGPLRFGSKLPKQRTKPHPLAPSPQPFEGVRGVVEATAAPPARGKAALARRNP